MDHFIHILTLPDNIPIVIMIFLLILCTGVAVYEMKENDKLIDEGKKDQIYDRMIR
jgi:hypothetical protein